MAEANKMTTMPTLSDEQEKVVDLIRQRRNVLLTGQAGTGKTTTVNAVRDMAFSRGMSYGVTAMTGCAALLIEGKTLHSFLGIGLATHSPQAMAAFTMKRNPKVYDRIMALRLLIIDEVSMMNAELFSKVSKYLRIVRGVDEPFGGIQVLLCGDFAQLPPVNGEFCFEAPEWAEMRIEVVVLSYQFRQANDSMFQKMLSRLRVGECSEEDLAVLKGCANTSFSSHIRPTHLYPKNYIVDRINSVELDKLIDEKGAGMCRRFKPQFHTNKLTLAQLKKYAAACGIPDELVLCVGAQVIVTYNVSETVVNGTRGVIIAMQKDSVTIETVTGDMEVIPLIRATPCEEVSKKDMITYLPIRLGYALSIHKSQGMTLDAVEMDLGRDIFEYGQAYVALSRAKTLEHVRITNVKASSFKIHPKVKAFYDNYHCI